MAIYHLSAQVISAAGGRSAVAAAAYRRAASMTCAVTGQSFSYEGKEHVTHTELSLPSDTPTWFRTGIDGRSETGASEFLWNAVERKEGVRGTGLAMEMNIALPVELTREQSVTLARDWIEEHVTAKGFIADWAIHDSPGNPHFHLMIPLRRLTEKGFAGKFDLARDTAGNVLYRKDGKPRYERMAASMKELIGWRRSWADTTNRYLAAAGLERRIDHRSHAEAGIQIEPTGHIGPTASNMALNGKEAVRVAEERERRARNAQAIIEDPSRLLPILTREKSVFDERDIAKALFRYIDDPALFETIRLRVGLAPDLVAVSEEVIDPQTERVIAQARWTTKSLLRAELDMQVAAGRLWTDRTHKLVPVAINTALSARSNLSDQQREAVRHVTNSERITVVVGFAGAGKSTMLGVANDAWKRSGYRVHGAALAGKAADGLQRSADIPSRTLASWELAWTRDRDLLRPGDVFVLDEAGMVSSEQLSRIVREVERRGAKLVLVGDAAQLQPIEAGAAFRSITETVGYVELSEIWRQADPKMRAASVALARGEVEAAIGVYREAGMVRLTPTRQTAREAVIAAWKPDYLGIKPDGRRTETLILAQTNQDVFSLNAMARTALKADGALSREARFMTARGERMFAPGDRVLFLENDARLGVKNGMLATVETAEAGRVTVRLDRDGMGDGRAIEVRAEAYRNLDHGYAATVHKSQGATLDRVHVLATPGMDRHLAYVAMTRHRHSAVLHASHEDFLPEWRRRKLDGKLGHAPTVEDYDKAALEGLIRRLSRDGSKETTLDYLGEEAFREAAAGLERPVSSASPASLEALARRLDEAGEGAGLDADRVRPQDLRALASAFAERRGMNGHAAILPGLLTRLRQVVRDLEHGWQRLHGLGARMNAALTGIQARAVDAAARVAPAVSVPPREPAPPVQPARTPSPSTASAPLRAPLIPALDLGTAGLDEAAIARIADDPGLALKREAVADEAAIVVQSPTSLTDAILAELRQPRAVFEERITALLASPDTFGGLNGKTGLFASKTAKAERDKAIRRTSFVRANALSLKDSFDKSLAGARQEELAYRDRLRIEIPALSPEARAALVAVGATPSGDRDAVMAKRITPELRLEIETFAEAVGRRFGANGAIGHSMERSLPPGHEPVQTALRHLMHGAGLVAAHLQRDTLTQVLGVRREQQTSRDLGLNL
ncbi:Ti-type conjugative transfer relaxase TraA [Methylorubrum thiocyanatum]|uniref:Ti-type conjugative transfer relaxase TraA n=1 Tax=Methylorubrum thiocyanatum TaxID=47958 RepID=UPI003F7EDE12